MRRHLIIGVAVAAIALAIGAPAQAAINTTGPTASVAANGDLQIDFRVSGLGNDSTREVITVSATLDATAHWACMNKSGGFPSAANKQDVQSHTDVTGSFTEDRNGSIRGPLLISVPRYSNLKCGSGQIVVLRSVEYFNIVVDSSWNALDANLGSVSRTFYV